MTTTTKAALTINARPRHTPMPFQNTLAPPSAYAVLAHFHAPAVFLRLASSAVVVNNARVSPAAGLSAASGCTCTCVLTTSSGYIDAQVVSPAIPPQSRVLISGVHEVGVVVLLSVGKNLLDPS